MATAEYRLWNSRGRPYSVALPVRQTVDLARAAGVGVLGVIGNEDHLKADFPEDHTPFTRTAWPNVIVGYVVTACDLADGPWSDRILAMARAGQLPWLKYMNFRGSHYNVKRGWKKESSSDYHLHLSVRSDHLNTAVNVNPFSAAPPPTQGRKARPMILGKAPDTGETVFLGDGWKCKALTSMKQYNAWADAGAVAKSYASSAEMFADIGRPEASSALDRIETALKAPANVTLTPEQAAYFAADVAGRVINGLLDALGALIRGTR